MNQFKENPVIEAERKKLREDYDNLFNLILKSSKGSGWHLQLLKVEKKYHSKTKLFIEKYSTYFRKKMKRGGK